MTIKSLENIAFEKIIDCLIIAFDGYFVEMPTNPNFYQKRWKAAKVDLTLSYGMFDHEKLVGFIINGIDTRNGVLTAYNTGTGVIPEYRQQKIIKQIYDAAIPQLKAKGVKKCLLEVITKNEYAIKAYKAIGFKIQRKLNCYSGTLNIKKSVAALVKKDILKVDFSRLPNQDYYSWDNHKNSILENTDYQYFEIENKGSIASYFIINPTNGYIVQCEVLENLPLHWNTLFSSIQQISNTIKINNVDVRFQDKIEKLQSLQIANTIDQFEMEMML